MGRGEKHIGFWCVNLKERDKLGKPGRDGRIIFKSIFKKENSRAWSGWIWSAPMHAVIKIRVP
jgi:hypothetical protein